MLKQLATSRCSKSLECNLSLTPVGKQQSAAAAAAATDAAAAADDDAADDAAAAAVRLIMSMIEKSELTQKVLCWCVCAT